MADTGAAAAGEGSGSGGGGTASVDGGTVSLDGGTVQTDTGSAQTDGGTVQTGDGGTAASGETGGGMVDACLDFRDPGSCSGPECEWQEGSQIEFDQGACGCAITDKGLCVVAGSYRAVDGPEAYVFDDDPDTVVVLDSALNPVPDGVSICSATDGKYCACAVVQANYCNF